MIDIGNELADYGDQDPAEQPRLPGFVRERRGGGVSIRLADLQAQGFNRTPPPGFRAHQAVRRFYDEAVRLRLLDDAPTPTMLTNKTYADGGPVHPSPPS